MITKYRIVHASGWVEFPTLPEAQAYRDEHHPGSSIVEITEAAPAE